MDEVEQTQFPALGLASGTSTQITHFRTVGRRRKDAPEAVSAEDRWHIGSVTKSMTALLLAALVDDGALSVDDPVSKYLDAHSAWDDVTLRDLSAHLGGFPANPSIREAKSLSDEPDARAILVAKVLKSPPKRRAFRYSNLGYMALGRVIEVVTANTWEAYLTKRVFEPLGLETAGFGAPPLPAPVGHRSFLGFGARPVDPDANGSDNPAFMGPAGTVHLSLADFARYAQSLLTLLRGNDDLVGAAAYSDVVRPLPGTIADGYGGGLIAEKDKASGVHLRWHNGSNSMWMSRLTLAPERDKFAVACTNIGSTSADTRLGKVCRDAILKDPA